MTDHRDDPVHGGFIVKPGEGRTIRIPGVPEVVTVKASGVGTNGVVSFHEVWHEPSDTGVPRHYHRNLDEMFYIVEGTMRVLVGEEESIVGPGAFMYVPRGTVHAWRPAGDTPVRDLLIVLPGGFERYFDEMQDLPTPEEDPEAWKNLNRRWDVVVVGPPLENE